MKLVFLGTPGFAVPSLRATVAAGHEVVAVFTQPDRPKGRGQKDSMPAVKVAAVELGLEVHQPEKVRAAASNRPSMKFIPGLPTNSATNRFAG